MTVTKSIKRYFRYLFSTIVFSSSVRVSNKELPGGSDGNYQLKAHKYLCE